MGRKKANPARRITAALERLKAVDSSIMHLDDGLRANFIVTRRYLLGDETVRSLFFDWQKESLGRNVPEDWQQQIENQILWATLMPWENYRALRMLRLLTGDALERLLNLEESANTDRGSALYLSPWLIGYRAFWASFFADQVPFGFFSSAVGYTIKPHEAVDWFATTNPNLFPIGVAGQNAAYGYVRFEADRRAAMLALALEAYKLEHKKLPASLDDLVDKYFETLPLDPYSGQKFVYLPDGIPAPNNPLDRAQFQEQYRAFGPIAAGVPCLWSPGQDLVTGGSMRDPGDYYYYVLRNSPVKRWEQQPLPTYTAWARGIMYPIPSAAK